MQHRIIPCFDPAAIAIHGLMAADFCVFEIICFLLGGDEFHILAQGALIAFKRQHAIGLFADKFPSDFPLAAHRIGEVSACRSR